MAVHSVIPMHSPRRKRFNFGHTFDRKEDEEEAEEIESGSMEAKSMGMFSDICEYCGKMAIDILSHLKEFHPEKYEELVFR